NCATGQTLTVVADCATATPFSLDLASAGNLGSISGCDTGGTNTGGWFEFTTGSVENITISTTTAMKLQILDACGGTEVACEGSSTSHIIVGLMANTNYKMAMWVDGTSSATTDICIQEGPICFVPTALEASNVTQTEATLSWTAPTNGTPTTYDVEVVTAGATPTGTPTDVGVSPGYVKSGLTAGVDYEFYVSTDCGTDGTSNQAGPEAFSTAPACGTTVFDSGGATGDYSTNELVTITFYPDTMANVAELEFLFVDLEENTFSGGFFDDISIYDGVDTSAPLIIEEVPLVDVAAGDTPLVYTATNSDGALTFVFDSDFSTNAGGYEFNFNCVARPACGPPSNFAASVIDGTSAELSWTNGLDGETMWDIEIVFEGDTPTGTPTENDVMTNPYTVATLSPGIRYDAYLRADCGNATSTYVGPVSFRTPGPGDSADTSIGLTVEATCDATTQTVIDLANAIDLGDVASCSAASGNSGAWYQFRPNRNTSAVFVNSTEDVQYALFTTDGSGNADIELECGTLIGGTQSEVSQLNFRDDYKLVIWDDSGSLTSTSICIEDGPSCPTPIDLGITNVTATTADFIWTPGSVDQTSFDVAVYVAGADITDPNVSPIQTGTVTTNSYTATGLTVGDSYDFYVTGDCDPANAGTDVSMMAGPLTYTQVGPGESCASAIRMTVEPDCATATPYTVDFSTAVNIGTGVASCDAVGVNTGVFIDFVAPANGGVIVNMTGATMEYALFDSCGGTELVCNNSATNSTGIISGLIAGNVYKMALWKDSATSGTSDICVQEAPSCLPVTNIDAANITTNGADISWDLGDLNQNLFEIEVVEDGQTQTGNNVITGVTGSPYTINTLLASTPYDVYIRADCGNGDFSDWTGPFSFDTACEVITPDYAET
ncbi:MAG: fibronectin type III domain-containing protein, partial [Pricia sp.]